MLPLPGAGLCLVHPRGPGGQPQGADDTGPADIAGSVVDERENIVDISRSCFARCAGRLWSRRIGPWSRAASNIHEIVPVDLPDPRARDILRDARFAELRIGLEHVSEGGAEFHFAH